jgi:DNA-directed RNA polymerase subunit H
MDEHVIDILFRSRKTLLKILEEKGYNITPYEKFGPEEIKAMIVSEKKNNLKMEFVHNEKETKFVVLYRLNKVKQSLVKLINSLNDEESDDYIPNIENTIVYVIVLEPVNSVDVFHNAALNALSRNINISFFQADSLVNDPRHHILVPPHELVNKEDIPALKKMLNIQTVGNLPFIRFHKDIQVRLLGALPGDVIKITRPSPSSGEEIVYKVCVP